MSPRFLADANFNRDILRGLGRRERSIDLLNADDAGLRGMPDPQVLALAAEQGRILLTHDVRTMPGHFAEFVTTNRSPGVLIVAQETTIGVAIEELLLVWEASEASEWVNVIKYLPL
jgi:hypothetical protein